MNKIDIKQVVDLPGVGEQYMGLYQSCAPFLLKRSAIDHVASAVPYHASDDADTLDLLMRGDEEAKEGMYQLHLASEFGYHQIPAFVDQWSKTGKGLLAHKYVMILRFNCFVELCVVVSMPALR